MKQKLHLLIILSLSIGSVMGQNQILKGHIYFQSSHFQPAVNVAIGGQGADTVSSKVTGKYGEFELKFSYKRAGDIVHLIVGNTALHNQPIEMVNDKDLDKIVIPNDPNQAVTIVVCPKGQKEQATMEYYNLIKNSFYQELKEAKNKLALALKNASADHKRIKELSANLKELQDLDDPAMTRKLAEYTASINKDMANPRVLQYLRMLEQHKPVREALKSLNLTSAISDSQKGGLLSKQADEELRIGALNNRLLHRYQQAAACYASILTAAEYIGSAEVHGPDYIEYLYTYLDGDRLLEADSVSARLINWIRKYSHIEELHNTTAYAYQAMGMLKRRLGSPKSLDEALEYDHKGLFLAQAHDDIENQVLISNNIGLLFKDLDIPDSARFYLYQCYAKFTPALQTAFPDVYVTVLSNIANTECKFYKNDTTAIRFFNLALKGAKRYKVDTLYYAMVYNGLCSVYASMGDTTTAYEMGLKAVSIAREIGARQYLSEFLFDLGQELSKSRPKEALKFLYEAILVDQTLYPDNNSDFGAAHYAIGEVYLFSNNPDSCYKYFLLAMKNREYNFRDGHGEYDRAVEAINLAIQMMCEKYGIAKTGTNQDKVPYYNELIALNKQFIFWRGRLFLRYQHMDEAIEDIKASLLVTSRDFQIHHDCYLSLAYYHLVARDYDLAMAALAKSLEIGAETESQNLANKATVQFNFKNLPDALVTLTRYEKLNPSDTLTFRNWAIYYAMQKDREHVITSLNKAISLGFNDLMWLKTDDVFQPFKDDEEFKKLIMRLH